MSQPISSVVDQYAMFAERRAAEKAAAPAPVQDYRSYQENEQSYGRTVTLPDGKQVPQQMIDDLKRVWPRNQHTGQWLAPYYLDLTHVDDPSRRCPNCNGPYGSGKLSAPTGSKRDHGKAYFGGDLLDRELVYYDCPVCSLDNHRQALIEVCGVNVARFDDELYDFPLRRSMVETIFIALSTWSSERKARGWMNIIGGMGSGKSWAGELVVTKLVNIGLEARYTLATRLVELPIDAIHAQRRDSDAPAVSDALGMYYNLPFLVVDELFLVNQRNAAGDRSFGLQHLIRMLDHRYAERHRLATIAIWDIDWWHISEDESGTVKILPNMSLADDLGLIVSRASEADWMAWTKIPDIRPAIGNRKRADSINPYWNQD